MPMTPKEIETKARNAMYEICEECLCFKCPQQKGGFCEGCCELCGYCPIGQCDTLDGIGALTEAREFGPFKE